jgi:hypothetical protein
MSKVVPLFGDRKRAPLHVVPDCYATQSDVAIMDAYRQQLNSMENLELLGEMVRFQEDRSRVGELTNEMIARGIVLFVELEKKVETQELRLIVKSYLRHLRFEMEDRRSK